MNLGINKEEAKFLIDVIHNTLKLTKYPSILISTYEYLGVDVKDILLGGLLLVFPQFISFCG